MSTIIARSARAEGRMFRIDLDRIVPSPHQPRARFDEDAVRELASSIRRYGLLSPLLVRRRGAGSYELVAGERRLRAMRLLGWRQADALLIGASADCCALIGLVENLQRENLHYLDVAAACRDILLRQNLTQEELAAALGKSPSTLANLLRLLRLGDAVLAGVRAGNLSERHARALLKLEREDWQLEFVRRTATEKLSVRQLEEAIEKRLRSSKKAAKPKPTAMIRDNRLVINAFNDTLRQLRRIGVHASSRVETRADSYDIIVTISTPQPQALPAPL